MAASVVRVDDRKTAVDELMHQEAVKSWGEHGVLCSSEKHVFSSQVAVELGIELNGPAGLIGASGSRLAKVVLGSLCLIRQRQNKVKLAQMVLGRWIFALQFRRPAMAVLSRAWDYITSPHERWASWEKLCDEITTLICTVPLLQADVRTTFSGITTCSDASETGGAVAIARSLSSVGKELLGHLSSDEQAPRGAILVISCFNGIGGAFRCYDLNGVRVEGLVSIEIDGPARRVVRSTWPHALEVSDVNLVDLKMVKEWANAYPGWSRCTCGGASHACICPAYDQIA